MNRCGAWNGNRTMLRMAAIAVCFSLLVAGCGTSGASLPTLPDLAKIATPEQARKVLADAELIRMAFRDSTVSAYQAKLITDQRYIQLRNYDNTFTSTWSKLADAVDKWDGLTTGTMASSMGPGGHEVFASTYPQLQEMTEYMKQNSGR